MSGSTTDDGLGGVASRGKAAWQDFEQTVLSGLALTVPFFVTVLVLTWVFAWVTGALSPLVDLLNALGLTRGVSELLAQLAAAGLLLGVVVTVGFLSRHGPDTDFAHRFDVLMEDLPGIGSIYTSVERMSDVLVRSDTDSFREVVLVEFPQPDSYTLAFLTADTPSQIETAAGCEEMQMVFVTMSPNPVTGGFLLNVPEERVYDVDLTVDQGMQAVMTTGMAIDASTFEEAEAGSR